LHRHILLEGTLADDLLVLKRLVIFFVFFVFVEQPGGEPSEFRFRFVGIEYDCTIMIRTWSICIIEARE